MIAKMNLIALLVAAGLAACSSSAAGGSGGGSSSAPITTSPTAQPSGGPGAVSPEEGPRAPLIATWEVVSGEPADGATMVLHLRLERTGRWPMPVNVGIGVPEGVRVVRGDAQTTLAANPEPGVAVLEFEITIDRVPQDDLVAVVDSRTEGAGFHAEPRYRFGRPEPEVQVPVRDGPHVQIGGHDLGPSIRVEQPPQDQP